MNAIPPIPNQPDHVDPLIIVMPELGFNGVAAIIGHAMPVCEYRRRNQTIFWNCKVSLTDKAAKPGVSSDPFP